MEQFAVWAYPKDENQNGEALKLVISVFGGIVVLIGLRAALIRAKASQKSVEIQSDSIQNQTYQIELSRNSQVNEQFKNAIEHLGADKESIILGGISELHFIANDNSEKFSQVVLNILCSKLRLEASLKKDADDINKTIVQTIFDYIFRTEIYHDLPTDISFCNLQGINIEFTEVRNCNLRFSILPVRMQSVDFINCDLMSVRSVLGNYQEIKFVNCQLFGSYFHSTKFENSSISNENDSRQKITCVDSQFKSFTFNCSFNNSEFVACQFDSLIVKINSISNINFSVSSFLNTDFKTANIYSCDFSACGFVNCKSAGTIKKSKFSGIKNEYEYFSLFHIEQLEKSLGIENNFSGFSYDPSLFNNNYLNKLSIGYKGEIENLYLKLKEKPKLFKDKKSSW